MAFCSQSVRWLIPLLLMVSALNQQKNPFTLYDDLLANGLPAYGIALPTAIVVPWLYILVSTSLITKIFWRQSLWVATCLFVVFNLIHLRLHLFPVKRACNCFQGTLNGLLDGFSWIFAGVGLAFLLICCFEDFVRSERNNQHDIPSVQRKKL